jgi:hypothetical protein
MGRPAKKKEVATPQQSSAVIEELRQRSKRGQPLNSGANRGDWLYASAIRWFGSWAAAVEAAGFVYGDVRRAGLTQEDLLRRLRAAASAAGEVNVKGLELVVRSACRRHYGTAAAAVEAAGFRVQRNLKWTESTVVAAIQEQLRQHLPVNAVAMNKREKALYVAGRRVFGTWNGALAAAGVVQAPKGQSKLAGQ